MNDKARITLTPEQETLLITLYARAQAGNPAFNDPWAQECLQRLDYDFRRLRVPYKTVVLVRQRARKLDALARAFLAEHPGATVLHLGCGLDSRFWRVDDGKVEWYDLDMPPVIDLRQQLFPESERYHTLAAGVMELEWVEQVQKGAPTLAVAEGLLMYMSEAQVQRLLLRLREDFQNLRLAADVFSKLTARSATRHPSLQRTGATIGWGTDDAHEIENWLPGARLLEEWYFSQDPDLQSLSAGYRLAYWLAGKLESARKAHRIVVYQIGPAPDG